MSVPVISFINVKAGAGTTSLVYHLAWMLHEMGENVLVADLDPQASLSSAFLDQSELAECWDHPANDRMTMAKCLKPLLDGGEVQLPQLLPITARLSLLPSEPALATIEEPLIRSWLQKTQDGDYRDACHQLTAISRVLQHAAATVSAKWILLDLSPTLGLINRMALIASDYVVIPLISEISSIHALRVLGPTLRAWRETWARDCGPEKPAAPAEAMHPLGYVLHRGSVRLDRPQPSDRWINEIPSEYRDWFTGGERVDVTPWLDPECLAVLPEYRGLKSLAKEARKPMFLLTPADGAIGAHARAARDAYKDYRALAERIRLEIQQKQD